MRLVFKWVAIVLGSLLALAGLAWGGLYLEDASYEPFEFQGVKEESREAIFLTWLSEEPGQGWEGYRADLAPVLSELHESGELLLALPMEHPALKHPDHPGTWSHFSLLVFKRDAPVDAISERLLARAKSGVLSGLIRSIDVLRLQSGLDLFYPKYDGLEREEDLEQSVEYVFSDPSARKEYYQTQYVFSGPAMADLHHRDKAGRFIGFELVDRKFSAQGMPEWDLVHIFGFTPWQGMKVSPFFLSTWNKHARRVFGPDATFMEVMKRWNKIRLKIQHGVEQNGELTLQGRT